MLIIMTLVGIGLISLVLLDAFETVVLPRRVTRQLRLSRLLFQFIWRPWVAIARRNHRPQSFLAFFGPLSLIMMLGIWAIMLVIGFALLHQVAEADLTGSIWHYLYFSGTTFFTLGDISPSTPLDRIVTIAESAMGFSFLAVIIGYLPVFYQAFSQRERQITLLDARAGSPPSAVEFLRRHCQHGKPANLEQFFIDWEHWAAELLESHLSYPTLGLFRSQHDNESWLAALTMVLDVSALIIATFDENFAHSASLTFAIARHAAVDLCQVYDAAPKKRNDDRLLALGLSHLHGILGTTATVSVDKLAALRVLYEPYVQALSEALLLPLPTWTVKQRVLDNWQTTAWSDSDGIDRFDGTLPKK